MAIIRLQHVHSFTDRHGHRRHYLRLPGRPGQALPGQPGSPQFLRAYHAAIAAAPAVPPPGAGRILPKSFDALAVAVYTGDRWAALRPGTQRMYRLIIDQLRSRHGAKPVAAIDGAVVQHLMREKSGRPTAANRRLTVLRMMLAEAVELGWRADNPAAAVRRHVYRSDGYPTWSADEIAAYRDHHRSGTVARLAFELLFNLGQRRGDICSLGRQHIRDGIATLRQQKTGQLVTIPVLPELAAELALVRHRHLTWLAHPDGTARSSNGFYNTFREWCAQAGIPAGRSPHGLRKAAAVRLAEHGCSAHELMAIFGWRTLKEAQRYCEAADRVQLARAGMARLSVTREVAEVVALERVANGGLQTSRKPTP